MSPTSVHATYSAMASQRYGEALISRTSLDEVYLKDSQIISREDTMVPPRPSQFMRPPPPEIAHAPARVVNSKLTYAEYGQICGYLEEDEHNFASLHGASGKTKVGQKYPSKTVGFANMAAILGTQPGFRTFDPPNPGSKLQKRYDRYLLMYKKARDFRDQTGSGLTDEQLENGETIAGLLEKTCPHFIRMDALFGKRHNIAPPCTGSYGFGPGSHLAEHIDLTEESEGANNWDTQGSPGQHSPAPSSPLLQQDFLGDTQQEGWTAEDGVNAAEGDYAGQEDDDINAEPASAAEPPSAAEKAAAKAAATKAAKRNSTAKVNNAQAQRTIAHRAMSGDATATSRASLASMYMEKSKDKTQYRMDLIASKEKWKTAELAQVRSMKEAELSAHEKIETMKLKAQEKSKLLERKHKLHSDIELEKLNRKRSKESFEQQCHITQMAHNNSLMLALLGSNKNRTDEEVSKMMSHILPPPSGGSSSAAADGSLPRSPSSTG